MHAKTNIISALINLYNLRNYEVDDYSNTSNRINDVGTGLENFIKKIFINPSDKNYPQNAHEYFSYQGAKNNPPDLILKGGDAFEIKKIGRATALDIQLNSSFPKNILNVNDPKLTSECRNCEKTDWKEKDIFYVIGVVSKVIESIFFVQGECLACSHDYYDNIFNDLKDHIANGKFTIEKTRELGRIKNIDPLNFTNLRIRPMVSLKNPYKIFDFCETKLNQNLNVFCLMTSKKYLSLKGDKLEKLEKIADIQIDDKKINHPMDKSDLLECKFIKFYL